MKKTLVDVVSEVLLAVVVGFQAFFNASIKFKFYEIEDKQMQQAEVIVHLNERIQKLEIESKQRQQSVIFSQE